MQNLIRIIILFTNIVFLIAIFHLTSQKIENYYFLNFQPEKLKAVDSKITSKVEVFKRNKKYYKYSILYNYENEESTYTWESKNSYDEANILKVMIVEKSPNCVIIPSEVDINDVLFYFFFVLASIFLEISLIIKLKSDYDNKKN